MKTLIFGSILCKTSGGTFFTLLVKAIFSFWQLCHTKLCVKSQRIFHGQHAGLLALGRG